MRRWLTKFAGVLILSVNAAAFANCHVLTSDHQTAPIMADSINLLLQSANECPIDVFAFRDVIKHAQLKLITTMVANRGFHNPTEGSFSFFEMVTGQLAETHIQNGDFFFGHFTAVNDLNNLIADQSPAINSLMIEAFAWDPNKELFNFYELRGDGKQGQWFYRGDSADIYADNTFLHRQPKSGTPEFGARLRCSGCHIAGAGIMKEIAVAA